MKLTIHMTGGHFIVIEPINRSEYTAILDQLINHWLTLTPPNTKAITINTDHIVSLEIQETKE